MSSEMTKGLSNGSEVIARRDFQSSTTEHLSFYKGDILTILGDSIKHAAVEDKIGASENNNATNCTQSEWYKAQHSDGRIGLVPFSHLQKRTEVKLNSTPWFHGKITRDEAEKLLQPLKVSYLPELVIITRLLSCKPATADSNFFSFPPSGWFVSC